MFRNGSIVSIFGEARVRIGAKAGDRFTLQGDKKGAREKTGRGGERGGERQKKWREIRIWPFLVTICRMVVHGD